MRLKYWYMRTAYFLGFKAYVYNQVSGLVASDQEKPWMLAIYGEACEYQKTLIKRGWFECPHCSWATKTEDEHILKGEGYCYEQHLELKGIDIPSLDDTIRKAALLIRRACGFDPNAPGLKDPEYGRALQEADLILLFRLEDLVKYLAPHLKRLGKVRDWNEEPTLDWCKWVVSGDVKRLHESQQQVLKCSK